MRNFFRPKFLIQVNYKTGAVMRFWVYSFTINGPRYEWEYCSGPRPLKLGTEEIESLWQLRARRWYYLF